MSQATAGKGIHPAGKSAIRKVVAILLLLATCALIFILYSNIVKAAFNFDDIPNIRNNPRIRIISFSASSIFEAAFKGMAWHRPVANISFALNYYFGGLNVIGYHYVNIVIHLLTGLFLFLLIRETLLLMKRKSLSILVDEHINPDLVAFAAALIWLVNPLCTQSVTYIVQRMTSLAAMFYTLSMFSYIRGRMTRRKSSMWTFFGLSLISGLLAVGSKEIAVTLPFFILLYEWYFFRNLDVSWLKRHVPVIVVLTAMAFVLFLYFVGWGPLTFLEERYKTREFTLAQRLLTEPQVVLMYLTLIFFPYPGRLMLDYDFSISVSLISPPSTLLSILIILGLICLGIYIAGKDRLISFAIFWFFGNLIIESTIIPLELVYEHRTYLPSMFMILLAVVAANKYIKLPWARIILLCIVAVVFSLWTYQRNFVWQNELTMWEDSVKKAPNKARTHNNYGLALFQRNKLDEAEVQFRKAIELSPNVPAIYNNLGSVLKEKGYIQQAIDEYRKSNMLDPNFIDAQINLALALDKLGNIEESQRLFHNALSKEPGNYGILNSLGQVLANHGRYDEALTYLMKSEKINPTSADTYNRMGNVMFMQGKLHEAQKEYLDAIRVDNTFIDSYYNLSRISLKQGRSTEAIFYLEKAAFISPNNEKIHFSLAMAYHNNTELDKSIEQLREVLRINPGNEQARKNLDDITKLKSNIDSAVHVIQGQIMASPDNAELHYKFGDLLQRRGDFDGAEEEMRRAIYLKKLPQAYHNLAVIYSMKGEYGKAAQSLEEMLRMKPDDPEIYYNLACIYSKQERVDDALRYLQNALSLGFNKWSILESDPDLESIRETDTYKKIVQKYRE